MFPRDNVISVIQRVARQALVTFTNGSRVGEAGGGRPFLENQSKLRSLLAEVRAADLKLVPRKVDGAPGAPHPQHGAPPVTYMHICETDEFSMGVFLLRNGASIPLHDHPGMHGMLKVMYGKVRVTCFDRLDKSAPGGGPPGVVIPERWSQKGALRCSVLRSAGELTEESAPCVLAPDRDNLHQIDAVDGPTAFLDILAPPYDPDDGRDCHYYKVLPPGVTPGSAEHVTPEQSSEVWLMEISQPPEFWCSGEPYPGPEVSL